MIKLATKIKNRINSKQSGQILIFVLIIFAIGSLMLPPLLDLMLTGLKTNQVYDDNTNVMYSADSGIEDAKWKIQYDKLTGYSPYNFSTPFEYTISDNISAGSEIGENINQYPVDVSIQNMWVLDGYIPKPTQTDATDNVNFNEVKVFGSTTATNIAVRDPLNPDQSYPPVSEYKFKIVYTHNNENIDALKVNSIGIWLPSGFEYVPSSVTEPALMTVVGGTSIQSQLESFGTTSPFYVKPQVFPSNGNQMVVWDYQSPFQPISAFPPAVLTQSNFVMTLEFSFYFRHVSKVDAEPNAVGWIITEGGNYLYAWNADVNVYQIFSEAGDTIVESYITKSELRAGSSSVSGDYYATGNTLMWNANPDYGGPVRDSWVTFDHSSSAEVTASAVGEVNSGSEAEINRSEIAAAYLYWTGWKSTEDISNIFTEPCNNLNEWIKSSQYQDRRVPTSDGDKTTEIWNTAPLWSKVDETTADDSDYITGSKDTDWLNPTLNSTDSGGDGNGFEVNPTRAYDSVTNSSYASNINGAADRHRFYGYATSIPAESTINGIEVRLDWWLDSTSSTNSMGVELSWDGGITWTAAKTATNESTSQSNTSTLGSSSDIWGHTWTISQLSSTNFRVRLTCNSTSGSRDFYLAWVPIRVTYSSPGQQLFNFSPFLIPAGEDILDLTLYFRAADTSSGTNNIRPRIKIGDAYYDGAASDPNTGFTTFSYVWTVNPATGETWTMDDINGSGAHPLRQFGIFSTDLSPGVRVSMVYALVNYGHDSLWTVSTGRFRGQGAATAVDMQRILTLRNSLDLSSYATGTVNMSWQQTVGGNLETADNLTYAFSGDGGNNWSAPIEAFHGGSITSPFSIPVPDSYLTTNFKVRFYFNFNDASEYVYLDNINITVADVFSDDCNDYGYWNRSSTGSRWSLNPTNTPANFRGTGSSSATIEAKTLTLKNSLDLSSFKPDINNPSKQAPSLMWMQTANLQSNDQLFFAFSGDNGSHWSNNILAMQGTSTNSQFSWQIPTDYLTSSFKMRFYLAVSSTSRYVDIDNIKLVVMAPDKSVNFKINGQQVYFDSGNNPSLGFHEITASKAETIPSYLNGEFEGYAYSCYKEVTSLVREFTRVDAGEKTQHSPGVAIYTVGGVDATLGIDDSSSFYQLAHAGWSLILVYTSPKTVGHQLYLYDRFSQADSDIDLDFDRDGLPGGEISGFIVPKRLEIDGVEEANVAKMTVFVGEGDDYYPGDFVAFQAPPRLWDENDPLFTGYNYTSNAWDPFKLWDGITTGGNSSTSPDDVWNDKSIVFAADGVDIDTFYIPWEYPTAADPMLEEGDTSAHLDMYTSQDIWNMVYVIISFRSKPTYGGAMSYLIHN